MSYEIKHSNPLPIFRQVVRWIDICSPAYLTPQRHDKVKIAVLQQKVEVALKETERVLYFWADVPLLICASADPFHYNRGDEFKNEYLPQIQMYDLAPGKVLEESQMGFLYDMLNGSLPTSP